MQAKILILTSYLCLYETSVVSDDRSLWSHRYKHKTSPHTTYKGDLESVISARNINKNKLWPNGIVPYVFADGYSDDEKQKILDLMDEIRMVMRRSREEHPSHRFCQVVFEPKSKFDNNYVEITKNDINGCASYANGMKKGKQILNLSPQCLTRRFILHELLHVLGFAHQHAAHNRDQYITILKDNIKDGYLDQFGKENGKYYTDYGVPYDFDSIMHYSSDMFAKRDKNGKQIGPTMEAKDPKNVIKENYNLSKGDFEKLEHMYCH